MACRAISEVDELSERGTCPRCDGEVSRDFQGYFARNRPGAVGSRPEARNPRQGPVRNEGPTWEEAVSVVVCSGCGMELLRESATETPVFEGAGCTRMLGVVFLCPNCAEPPRRLAPGSQKRGGQP